MYLSLSIIYAAFAMIGALSTANLPNETALPA
jgi:hypothetical protein